MRGVVDGRQPPRVASTRVLLLLLLAITTVLLLPAPAALAHSEIVGTSPEQGARLATLPASAVLVFGGPLSGPVQVAVRGPDGESSSGTATVDGATLEVPLTSRGAGSYEVYYRVTGADGHLVSGRLSFRADAAGPVGADRGPGLDGPPASGTSGTWWWLVLLLPLGLVPVRRRLRPAVTTVEDHRH